MKKLTTSIVATTAALLLTAAPIVAGNTDKKKSTDEDVKDVKYERTNPDADSQAPHAGLTIYGTVQDFNEDQLTLKTSTGVEHLQIVSQTNYPVDLEAGTHVAVDYNRNTQGVMIAKEIRMDTGEAMAEQGDVETEMEPISGPQTAEARETEAQADTEADVETEMPVETEVTAETEVAATTETETPRSLEREQTERMAAQTEELPRTAGNLPLFALLGLIGLAGAGTLHLLRS